MTATTSKPQHRRVLSAATLANDRVRNRHGEDLGRVEEIMIDVPTGKIAYVVLSFGGVLGLGDKLFAVPWTALEIDEDAHQFVFDVERSVLENAPGFDKDNWPDFADTDLGSQIHHHYGRTPYWEHDVTDAGDYVGDGRQPNRDIEFEPSTAYRAGKR